MDIETERYNLSDSVTIVRGAEYRLIEEYSEKKNCWFYYLSIVPNQPAIELTLRQYAALTKQLFGVRSGWEEV